MLRGVYDAIGQAMVAANRLPVVESERELDQSPTLRERVIKLFTRAGQFISAAEKAEKACARLSIFATISGYSFERAHIRYHLALKSLSGWGK